MLQVIARRKTLLKLPNGSTKEALPCHYSMCMPICVQNISGVAALEQQPASLSTACPLSLMLTDELDEWSSVCAAGRCGLGPGT